jgi:hypothetical protein
LPCPDHMTLLDQSINQSINDSPQLTRFNLHYYII